MVLILAEELDADWNKVIEEAKKEGKEVVATPEPKQEKVVDILEALKASLAVAKKPAAIAQSITPIAEKTEPKRKRARG